MSRTTLRVRGPARLSLLTFTRDAMRSVDAACAEEFAIPPVVLMENAAAGIAAECLDLLTLDAPAAGAARPRVLIFTGPGNNGGDGFAVARRLHNHAADVTILAMRAPSDMKGEAGLNAEIARRMDLDLRVLDPDDPSAAIQGAVGTGEPPAIVIDALFGTGLTDPLRPPADEVVRALNRVGRETSVVSVDCPSGLNVDEGRPAGEDVVQATHTVTLGGMKKGLLEASAARWCGRISVADIGAPFELLERFGEPAD